MKFKALARRNDSDFAFAVRVEHSEMMIARYGADIKQRALNLFRLFHPACFDNDGFLNDYADAVYDLDLHLSNIAMSVLDRKINRTPELQLHEDWGDLPKNIVDPQMRMF